MKRIVRSLPVAAFCIMAAGCVSLEVNVSEQGSYNPTDRELEAMTAKALGVPSSSVYVSDKVAQTASLKKSGGTEAIDSKTVIYYNAKVNDVRKLCFVSHWDGKTAAPVCASVDASGQ